MTIVIQLPSVTLQEIRADLEGERARLLKQRSGTSQPGNDDFGYNLNRDDLASSHTLFGQQSILQSMEQKKLEQIEKALQRLDAGLYGLCAECGGTIEPERLELLPAATLCSECQQRATA